MKKLFSFSIGLILLIPFSSFSQNDDALKKGLDAITKESVKAQVEFLSSDWMEGRATGEKGEFLAGDYLASMLEFMGIEAAGDIKWTSPTSEQWRNGIRSKRYTSYFQNIAMTKQIESSTKFSISLSNNQTLHFNENVDFSSEGTNISSRISSDIVFVGYGFTDKTTGYDDYNGIDVKGKIILRLYGYPGINDDNSPAYKKFHKEEQYFYYYLNKRKNKIAKEKGVAVIIDIYPEDDYVIHVKEKDFTKLDYNEDSRSPIYDYDYTIPSDSLNLAPIKIFPTKKVIHKILENQNINLEDFETKQANSLKPIKKKIKNITANIDYNVQTEFVQARNILGVIAGANPNEIVVVGAHYDHLGIKEGIIWNGADDNASGTVGVWMLAKAFKEAGIKPKKTIIFAAWTGEEIGLLGSEYFTKNPYGGSIDNIKFYLNFDMISKDSKSDTLKNKARMLYTYNTELENISDNNINTHNLNLDMTYIPNPHRSSDHTSFMDIDIPIMYFCAGYPSTLHTPRDETYDINWDKMVDIIKLSYLNLWEIVNE